MRCFAIAALFALGAPLSSQSVAEPRSSGTVEVLRAAIARAELSALRRPDFREIRQPVADFYARREHRPAWIAMGAPTAQALSVVSLLAGAESRGLPAEEYDGLRWPRRIVRLQRGADAAEVAEFDLALTVNLMRLARDLHVGRVDPRRIGLALEWPPKPLDLAALAAEVADARDPAARIEALEPPFSGYRRLKHALVRYLELARERDVTELPVADVVRPGDRYAGSAALTELLVRLGDLRTDTAPPEPGDLYDGPLVDAVRSFQRRHGLEEDGKIGRETFAALRVPLSTRVQQIGLALERWRWVPAGEGRAPIVVNLPEFRLRAFDADGQLGFSSRVIVGKAFQKRTPVFTDRLRAVIFRPTWTVPVSIARNEIVPIVVRDPDYLRRENLEIVGALGDEPTASDLAALRRGTLMLRQRPGPANSLGLVKFDFPNTHDVYLHDTPARGLFARARRDFSHGCIRVEDAAGLAAWALRHDPAWTESAIRAAMDRGVDERAVAVVPPIPLYIVYLTAVAPEEEEQPRFFADLYGHDERLAAALASGEPALRTE